MTRLKGIEFFPLKKKNLYFPDWLQFSMVYVYHGQSFCQQPSTVIGGVSAASSFMSPQRPDKSRDWERDSITVLLLLYETSGREHNLEMLWFVFYLNCFCRRQNNFAIHDLKLEPESLMQNQTKLIACCSSIAVMSTRCSSWSCESHEGECTVLSTSLTRPGLFITHVNTQLRL